MQVLNLNEETSRDRFMCKALEEMRSFERREREFRKLARAEDAEKLHLPSTDKDKLIS